MFACRCPTSKTKGIQYEYSERIGIGAFLDGAHGARRTKRLGRL